MGSLPVKVVLTEQLSLSGKTLVRECAFAVVTADAFYVPHSIQNLEQEFVRNRQFTSRALLDHAANLRLHPDNSIRRQPTQLASVLCGRVYVYVKYRLPRVKFIRVTLLRARWVVRLIQAAAERDGKMDARGGIVDFLNTDALFYSAVKICI